MTDLYLMRNIPTEREKRHTVMYREYVAAGGYAALKKALLMKPQEIVETIKTAELRGRGGAGFPCGL